MDGDGWLPNLAGGVSVWKLADDLNAPHYFGGRLLEPELEGPDNLPTKIEWNVTGLVPLSEARTEHEDAVVAALAEFLSCVDRAGRLFDEDGYEDYARAFTVPGLEGDGAAQYWFDPAAGKLLVANWGATPRGIGPRSTPVYDRLHFAQLVSAANGAFPTLRRHGAVLAAGGVVPGVGAEASPGAAARKKRRGWLVAILAALFLAAVASVLILLLLDDDPAPAAEPPSRPAPGQPSDPEPLPPPEPPPAPEAPAPPIPAPHQKIYFDVGDHRLTTDQTESLEAIRAYLRSHERVRRLRIEGHTDFQGAEDDNQALSVARAERVAAWLIEHGVDPQRLDAVGCSEHYPEDGSRSRAGRSRNRRVELHVLEPPPEGGVTAHARCQPR